MEKEKEKEKTNVYSPDTVLEDFLRTAESETDSSKASTSESEAVDPKPASRWAVFFQLLRFKSKRKLATLHPLNALSLSKRFSGSMREEVCSVSNPLIDADLNYFKPQWKNFSFSELQTATSNFCQGYLIGKGGYAEVYRGRLRGGQLVAIKRLMKGPMEERIGDFLSELGIMAHVNHPNTAKVIGYGVEGGMYLVLEFSPIGSLASMLHSSRDKVEWDIRYKVAVGTAKGLLYLHEGCQRRIIHRDIKAANILLTEDFEPQICDFGLAKWLPDLWTHLTVSKFEGTFGYLAPEFLMHGIVDEKTDVFAFGVLLLELITGRRALDYSQQSLVMWAKPLLKKNKISELIDPSLAEAYNPMQMNLMILAASLCVQQSSIKRPRMSQVLLLLRGSCGSSDIIKKCKKLSSWKKYYKELFSAEKYSFGRGVGVGGLTLQTQMAIEA
ncbi:receptor-like cytosolic serine/threonine-protein kinase RBK2 [Sesamum indicum]|uniref:non-specific serine/threonine protein kinase n=1 Tax=Sesamum indicum TaxID=4182 RepID=A0A6I9T6N6_SESIN|nr:receptor-like cytosolic serine/threonine-protein kinase RBK2 [Sesamum indicum]XP_011079777.1 receptor-like cytosolic serine/threonine-protein kinase RBK2 [Sesamum indicum]XP_020549858.1 receptor-like cytosolic serine/threonine-protein kinase RBK2 [Sesamum indicum]